LSRTVLGAAFVLVHFLDCAMIPLWTLGSKGNNSGSSLKRTRGQVRVLL